MCKINKKKANSQKKQSIIIDFRPSFLATTKGTGSSKGRSRQLKGEEQAARKGGTKRIGNAPKDIPDYLY
jgi:hypothetical protein